jgi:hypothetical protein
VSDVINNPVVIKLNSLFENSWVWVESNGRTILAVSFTDLFERNLGRTALELDAI